MMNQKSSQGQFLKRSKTSFIRTTEFAIFIVLIGLCALLSLIKPQFLSVYNFSTLFRQIAFITIVAFGQTLVLITAGIDLSVGAAAALSGIMSAWLMVNTPINPWICIVLGLVVGCLVGLTNGFLITKVKINPFIVTLATGEIFGGFIYVITQGWAIQNIPESVLGLGRGSIAGIPIPVWIMIIVGFTLALVMKFTPFGRYIYAIGGNMNAAKLVGIKVDKVKVLVYVIADALAAMAGILITCRLGAAQPTVGLNWVMPSVTAAILGGTSMSGGQGNIAGTIIGAALMGVISNAIVLLSVSPYWEKVITGCVVLIAVILDRVRANMDKR